MHGPAQVYCSALEAPLAASVPGPCFRRAVLRPHGGNAVPVRPADGSDTLRTTEWIPTSKGVVTGFRLCFSSFYVKKHK